MKHNLIGWVEIPVSNMERAMAFYQSVFNINMPLQDLGDLQMAFFPNLENEKGSGGALVKHTEFYKPSQNGVLVYFSPSSGDLSIELNRVEAAGGKVLIQKRQISAEHGFMGLFLDSEGNRIALHQK
ncbi:MAG: glyoxalase [Flavobacteriales bacterium CG_4_9_14_0_2_um_filter_35_242]|nr:VOC family protein [Zetaproteobacteria bacterium]NDK18656.1 VOC family protein [Flavobacteriales bacterium]OIO10455.1 MAG: glyoxalase [Flavobacteriaceae bacterium CG1_02_35_72]PJA05901.1 MAG: glyoxalase [Flavobacteriales bacterium CG_4_10_14_0_2_um_filter_35_18]PJC58824.1 MAG: glyoxalase [Flavobacteriales bacterium CG_4_9_14_0_2_um_filter_35_242]